MARQPREVPARELSDADLERELRSLYETRGETFFGGNPLALHRHTERMQQLEAEYATRHAEKMSPHPGRTRAGSRARAGQPVERGSVSPTVRRRSPRVRTEQGEERPSFVRRTRETTTPRAETRRPEGPPKGTRTNVGRRTRGTLSSSNRPRSADEGREPGWRKRGKSGEAAFRGGVKERGKRTGRGRDVPGLPESLGRKGGVAVKGRGKSTGASNRTVNRPAGRSTAVRNTVGGRRSPKSGLQG